jgi:hypothetical protein
MVSESRRVQELRPRWSEAEIGIPLYSYTAMRSLEPLARRDRNRARRWRCVIQIESISGLWIDHAQRRGEGTGRSPSTPSHPLPTDEGASRKPVHHRRPIPRLPDSPGTPTTPTPTPTVAAPKSPLRTSRHLPSPPLSAPWQSRQNRMPDTPQQQQGETDWLAGWMNGVTDAQRRTSHESTARLRSGAIPSDLHHKGCMVCIRDTAPSVSQPCIAQMSRSRNHQTSYQHHTTRQGLQSKSTTQHSTSSTQARSKHSSSEGNGREENRGKTQCVFPSSHCRDSNKKLVSSFVS